MLPPMDRRPRTMTAGPLCARHPANGTRRGSRAPRSICLALQLARPGGGNRYERDGNMLRNRTLQTALIVVALFATALALAACSAEATPTPRPTVPAVLNLPTQAPTKAAAPTASPAATRPPVTTGTAMVQPADHAGRTADTCLACHSAQGIKPMPVGHVGRTVETCTACHFAPTAGAPTVAPTKPAAGAPTAVATAAPTKPAGTAKAQPADHAGRTSDTCMACHGPAGLKPVPASHAGRTADTCAACHPAAGAGAPTAAPTKPATGAPTVAPTKPAAAGGIPAFPANHAGRVAESCLICHGSAGIEPLPASHAGRTADTCLACHKPG
jgi:hypothetical protein